MFPPISPFGTSGSSSPFLAGLPTLPGTPTPTPTPPGTCGGLVGTVVGGAIGLALTVAVMAMCPSLLLLPKVLKMPRELARHKLSLEGLAEQLQRSRE